MVTAEYKGYVGIAEGEKFTISNKYGVVSSRKFKVRGADIESQLSKELELCYQKHRVWNSESVIKRVAYDEKRGEYIQLQALYDREEKVYVLQIFDNELMFMEEIWTGCKYKDEVCDWMHTNYNIVTGLPADVYKDGTDCTNYGISASRKELYIVSKQRMPFEPSDIRQCVKVNKRNIMGAEYINAVPLYFSMNHYMAGGNFVYTMDSRYKDIVGLSYPIAIHDRYEGDDDTYNAVG